MAEQAQRIDGYEEAMDVLPGFVAILINSVLLPLLLLAEGYLLGSLFSRGWVDDIEVPNHWGTYHGVGVVLLFAAGVACGGLALRASVALAGNLRRQEWGFSFLNALTVVGFAGAEIWSSFAERSFHLITSPADKAVLSWWGLPTTSGIDPTLVVVSVIIPFASLTFGFSQLGKARKTAAERDADEADEDARRDKRLKDAELAARLAEIRAGGARRAFNAARGKAAEEAPAVVPFASRNGRHNR